MKSINEWVCHWTDEFDEHNKSHQRCYNKLLKWYDQCVKYMEDHEIICCLEYALEQWEDYNFDEL